MQLYIFFFIKESGHNKMYIQQIRLLYKWLKSLQIDVLLKIYWASAQGCI